LPLVRRWQKQTLAVQLGILLSVSLVVIGGLVIAIVGLATAQQAGREAKSAVSCVNTVLGDRNGVSAA
jgi:hypothetical protein